MLSAHFKVMHSLILAYQPAKVAFTIRCLAFAFGIDCDE
ncbi:hypothetical protein PCIT_a2470 [Pseudoalteromonas citrea]|uniref:Uncharacterized protein n=1 Tax=Pseudoalteromonas citrea TaxID=43655 RepID=A0AAD4AJT5_9GAMM|nr:hypothetical protein PCIT_a2470 [Pseudoalteromonas citrea]